MSRFSAPAILALLVILFNWKLVFTNQYTWLDGVDMVTQVLPWFQYQAGEWHNGRIPLWDPTSWYGQPILGQGQPGGAYPLNWLLFWSSLRNGWMRESHLNWYYVLIRVLAALSMYGLCRELGRSRMASVLGGLLYAIGGYVGNIDWPQMVNGAITSPLVFLYLFRYRRTQAWRDVVLSGFFMGFGWLAGHHQMNLLVSIAAAGLWLWIRKPVALAAAAGVAILASGLVTVPMAEFARLAVRWAGAAEPLGINEKVPYFVHQGLGLEPEAVLAPFLPGLQTSGNSFVGLAAMALAIAGAILWWKDARVRWLSAMGVLAMVYGLGFYSVFHGWMYSLIPLIEKSRVPAASNIVFAIAVAPLAALGLDVLPSAPVWCLRLAKSLGIAAVFLIGVGLCGTLFHLAVDKRIILSGLAAVAVAVALAGWRFDAISARAGSVMLIMTALLELGLVTNYNLPTVLVPEQVPRLHLLADHSDLAAFLHARADEGRLDYDGEVIPYNFGAWYGLPTYIGAGASALEAPWRLGIFSHRSRDFFGVRFYAGTKPNRPDQVLIFKGKHGINLYENPGAYPRAFAVHQTLVEPDMAKYHGRFEDPKFDPRTQALVPYSLPLETCDGGDEVRLIHLAGNEAEISATLACRGLVILTDNWFPGWRAMIDGRAADLVKVNGAVRGVVVEAGAHSIRMEYRPWSVIVGAAMTVTATLLAAFLRR